MSDVSFSFMRYVDVEIPGLGWGGWGVVPNPQAASDIMRSKLRKGLYGTILKSYKKEH